MGIQLGVTNKNRKLVDERFWSKVNKTSTCWLWLGRPNSEGYGEFAINKKSMKAHRFSYELIKNIKIEKGFELHHINICNNKMCVNPDHLELLTKREHSKITYEISLRIKRSKM